MSELDDFLAREIAQGELQSSGQFTLTREKALEKLAAFQLPNENAWVLKVVQAAVLGGYSQLNVRLSSSNVEFGFMGDCGWSLEDFEQGFYDPESSSDRSLQALKQALWSVSLHGGRPFQLVGRDWRQALFWNGQQLTRQPLGECPGTRLTVSHRVRGDNGFPLLRGIEAARRNSELLQELRQKAFTCPIPLRADARRVDALHLCPGHGLSSSSYPLQLGFFPGELPRLNFSELSQDDYYQDTSLHRDLEKLVRLQSPGTQNIAVAAFLTGHVKEVTEGKSTTWKAYEHPCRIYWVLHGVVIDCRAFAFPARSCSLGLVASAEGLTTDLSGFNLQVNPEYRARLEQVCRLVDPFVAQADLCFDELLEKARANGKWVGAFLVVGGLGAAFFSPIHGAALTVGGAVAFFNAASNEKAMTQKITEDLRWLQADWRGAGTPGRGKQ